MQEFSVKKSYLDFRTREAYKMLRTNIEFSGDNNKVIFITSTTPGEGKSTVSFELAMSFAQNGMKTLLIDADTRKSVMKNRWRKGKIKYGLTHYLSGKNELTDVISVSDEPNFCMIFAGPVPPNPSELVGNDRFAELIESARETFDMIIVDTPPIGSVIDAAVIDLPNRLGLLLHTYPCNVFIILLVYSSNPVLSIYISELIATSNALLSGLTNTPIRSLLTSYPIIS